jgi:cation transport ATPase
MASDPVLKPPAVPRENKVAGGTSKLPLVAAFRLLLVVIAVAGLLAGTAAWILTQGWAEWAWAAGTAPVLAALTTEIVVSLRRGNIGLDVVAALSMSAALMFGEHLAGNVVALMYAGGQLLESYAEGRARREMTALLGRVAHTAMRYSGGHLEEVPIEVLGTGDRILVRHGEVVPVDGTLASTAATIDQSALTGEGMPVAKHTGDEVLSGATNVGNAFQMNAARPAAESTYANIVRLVREAEETKAPSVRMADRYAIWFLLLTLLISGAAWWISGDRVRTLAVLVVATPCPLILALPVAIISGIEGRSPCQEWRRARSARECPHRYSGQDRDADVRPGKGQGCQDGRGVGAR